MPTSDAARDRWEGSTDARLERATDRLDVINGDLREIRSTMAKISIDLAVLKTRAAMYSAAGAILGGGFVSFIVQHFAAKR
jgi:hypothetical protein